MRIPRVIFGGGLSGRIVSSILGYPIIEVNSYPKEYGGEGLCCIQVDDYMKTLLVEMNLPINILPIKSGVFISGHMVSTESLDDKLWNDLLNEYSIKTRRIPYDKLPLDDRKSIMGGMRINSRYSCSIQMLWEKLIEKTDIRTIYELDIRGVKDGVINTDYGDIHYDQAINTLPLDLFAEYPSGLEVSSSKTFHFEVEPLFDNVDFLYVPSEEYQATRLVFLNNMYPEYNSKYNSNSLLVEMPSKVNFKLAYDEILKMGFRPINYHGVFFNPRKYLLGDPTKHLNKLDTLNIVSLGRFAEWDNSLLLIDVVKGAMELARYNTHI